MDREKSIRFDLRDISSFYHPSKLYQTYLENLEPQEIQCLQNQNNSVKIAKTGENDQAKSKIDEGNFWITIDKDKLLDIDESKLEENIKTTVKEFLHLVSVCDYWGFDKLPWLIMESYFRMSDKIKKSVLKHLKQLNLDYAREIGEKLHCLQKCFQAANKGHLECLEYLHGKGLPWDESVCEIAANNGHLVCLQYAHENGCPWNLEVLRKAAGNGHLDCLIYGYENSLPLKTEIAMEAAKEGHLNILKFLHEKIKLSNVAISRSAIISGQIECLKFLFDLYPSSIQSSFLDTCIKKTKKEQKLECVKILIQYGVSMYEYHTENAALIGASDILQYLLDQGCEIGENLCHFAVLSGSLDCLRIARENGCEWDENICIDAASNGFLDCLKYAHENHCNWNSEVCRKAAKNGHLACLIYAHENGCRWNRDTCESAAMGDHMDCLIYAHENGCKWDSSVTTIAGASGNLKMLKYAYENGCPFEQETFMKTSICNFECVKYAYEQGCKWPKDIGKWAALSGNYNSLVYVYTHGVKMHVDDYLHAKAYGFKKHMNYIRKGIPNLDEILESGYKCNIINIFESNENELDSDDD